MKSTKSIIEVSSLKEFDTTMNNLYRKLELQKNSPNISENDLIHDALMNGLNYDSKFSDIFKDYGEGRISSGLKSLELISIMCGGTDVSNLFLFDNIINFGTPIDFINATDDELIKLVLINVGMYDVVQRVGSSTVLDKLSLTVGKQVKIGNYTSNMYSASMRLECKKILEKYLTMEARS